MESEQSTVHRDTFLKQLQRLGERVPAIKDRIALSGRPAAVIASLILPRWQGGIEDARLLYIKRAQSLRHHSGQMAFPGGMVEKQDRTILDAAFRECEEEVGLKRELTKYVGKLPSASTPSGFSLHPYFVATTQQQFVREPGEVESIHLISVEELLHCPVRIEYKTWQNTEYRVIYFDTESVCIWGVTGSITEILLSHFFAWKAPR